MRAVNIIECDKCGNKYDPYEGNCDMCKPKETRILNLMKEKVTADIDFIILKNNIHLIDRVVKSCAKAITSTFGTREIRLPEKKEHMNIFNKDMVGHRTIEGWRKEGFNQAIDEVTELNKNTKVIREIRLPEKRRYTCKESNQPNCCCTSCIGQDEANRMLERCQQEIDKA